MQDRTSDRAKETSGGIGTGTFVVGCVLLIAIGMFWLMMPAAGRMGPMKLSSSLSVARSLSYAAHMYETNEGVTLDPDRWLQTLVDVQYIEDRDRTAIDAPRIKGAHYFLVPAGTIDARTGELTEIHVYEHPNLFRDTGTLVMRDGWTRCVPEAEAGAMITALQNPDGTTFAPHDN